MTLKECAGEEWQWFAPLVLSYSTCQIFHPHDRNTQMKEEFPDLNITLMSSLPVICPCVETWKSSLWLVLITCVLRILSYKLAASLSCFEESMGFSKFYEKNLHMAVVWWCLDKRKVVVRFLVPSVYAWSSPVQFNNSPIFWLYALFPMLELMLDFSLICAIWSSIEFYFLTRGEKIEYKIQRMSMRRKTFCVDAT